MVAPRFVFTLGFIFFIHPSTHADAAPADDYLRSLQIAQRKVERQNGSRLRGSGAAAVAALSGAPAGASGERAALISSEILTRITGRGYQVGDHWEVAAVRIENPMARMISDPDRLQPSYSAAAFFRYTVREAENAPGGKLVVTVEQIATPSAPIIDPKVSAVILTLASDSTQTRKEYQIGRKIVSVSPEGVRSPITSLEFYPLDLPEIRTAEALSGRSMPELPARLQQAVAGRVANVDSASAIWFEQDDFFGRPVQALWRKGAPWPTYLKTANGIAVLLSAGGTTR